MSDIECPYCGQEDDIDHDGGYGYEPETIHEQFCSGCEKTYAFETEINYLYYEKKADCLNGWPCVLEPVFCYPRAHGKMRCKVCDKTTPLSVKELGWPIAGHLHASTDLDLYKQHALRARAILIEMGGYDKYDFVIEEDPKSFLDPLEGTPLVELQINHRKVKFCCLWVLNHIEHQRAQIERGFQEVWEDLGSPT